MHRTVKYRGDKIYSNENSKGKVAGGTKTQPVGKTNMASVMFLKRCAGKMLEVLFSFTILEIFYILYF